MQPVSGFAFNAVGTGAFFLQQPREGASRYFLAFRRNDTQEHGCGTCLRLRKARRLCRCIGPAVRSAGRLHSLTVCFVAREANPWPLAWWLSAVSYLRVDVKQVFPVLTLKKNSWVGCSYNQPNNEPRLLYAPSYAIPRVLLRQEDRTFQPPVILGPACLRC